MIHKLSFTIAMNVLNILMAIATDMDSFISVSIFSEYRGIEQGYFKARFLITMFLEMQTKNTNEYRFLKLNFEKSLVSSMPKVESHVG